MAKWKYIEERLDLKICEKLHSNHHSNHHSIRWKYRYELVEKSKKWCYRTFIDKKLVITVSMDCRTK